MSRLISVAILCVGEGQAGQGAGLARADVQEAGQGPRQGDVIEISTCTSAVTRKLTLVVPSSSFLFLLTDMQLETFKRHLMQSLGDDNSQVS